MIGGFLARSRPERVGKERCASEKTFKETRAAKMPKG
jgi:hypothetical protein